MSERTPQDTSLAAHEVDARKAAQNARTYEIVITITAVAVWAFLLLAMLFGYHEHKFEQLEKAYYACLEVYKVNPEQKLSLSCGDILK